MSANNLGVRSADGAKLNTNYVFTGGWVVTFKVDQMPAGEYEVWHGMALGPGGFFIVYIDDNAFGVGENGLINEYAPPKAMKVRDGQLITINWSTAAAMPATLKYTAPKVWLYLQQPEGIR